MSPIKKRTTTLIYSLEYNRSQINRPRVRAFFSATPACLVSSILLPFRNPWPRWLAGVSGEINAVLNRQLTLLSPREAFPCPFPQGRPLHARVSVALRVEAQRREKAFPQWTSPSALPLDFGFHAPTVYFPPLFRQRIDHGPSPTETESKENGSTLSRRKLCSTSHRRKESRRAPRIAPTRTLISPPPTMSAPRSPSPILVYRETLAGGPTFV